MAPPSIDTQARPRRRPLVGAQIRRLRTDRHLTLATVAKKTGLNVGYLSQVETDKASPSLETLAAVADALEVPLTWFFSDLVPPPLVVRKDERECRLAFDAEVEVVDGGLPRSLRIVEATLGVGVRTQIHAHPGEEHHLVIAGRVRLTQGDHSIELGPGDYLLWDATLPHAAEQIGDEPCRIVIVTAGPTHPWRGTSEEA